MKLIIFLILVILCTLSNGQWIANTLYNMNDGSCTGPKLVTNYYKENSCNTENGVISVCTNQGVQIREFENKNNCTGKIIRKVLQPINKCLPGATELNCTSSFEFPDNSYIALQSTTCNDYKDNIISVVATYTNVCQIIDSTSINYKCTSDSAIGSFYYSDNCSGKPIDQKMPFSTECNENTNTTYVCTN